MRLAPVYLKCARMSRLVSLLIAAAIATATLGPPAAAQSPDVLAPGGVDGSFDAGAAG
jgi:hypothetical protein